MICKLFINLEVQSQTRNLKKAVLFLTFLSLSLNAFAGRPKLGPGLNPGVNDGVTSGGTTNTEVSLPVGLPSTGGDPSLANSTESTPSSNIVYTFDLNEENGAASINQTHSAFEKARNMNAACVLIRINSFAGGWDAAESIRQEILSYDRPVMVYVNDQAVSAASFISSGADSVYTNKGAVISNRKSTNGINAQGKAQTTKSIQEEVASNFNNKATSSSEPSLSNDITMSEILYKAGLGNLTVVEHDAGYSEQIVSFLTSPFLTLLVLLIAGFVLRKAVHARYPGPMMYGLAMILLLILAPFQLAGLASGIEIGTTVVCVVMLIISARYNKRWMTLLSLAGLGLMFTLIQIGDFSALLEYSSKAQLFTQPILTLGCLTAGWFAGLLFSSKLRITSRSIQKNVIGVQS